MFPEDVLQQLLWFWERDARGVDRVDALNGMVYHDLFSVLQTTKGTILGKGSTEEIRNKRCLAEEDKTMTEVHLDMLCIVTKFRFWYERGSFIFWLRSDSPT